MVTWKSLPKPPAARRSKFGSKKYETMGITFDSVGEGHHYERLVLLQRAGDILTIKRQVEYDLIIKDLDGKDFVLESYRADFVVEFANGDTEIQDYKGFRTKEYIRKKKWMKRVLGLDIVEYPKKAIVPKSPRKKKV